TSELLAESVGGAEAVGTMAITLGFVVPRGARDVSAVVFPPVSYQAAELLHLMQPKPGHYKLTFADSATLAADRASDFRKGRFRRRKRRWARRRCRFDHRRRCSPESRQYFQCYISKPARWKRRDQQPSRRCQHS